MQQQLKSKKDGISKKWRSAHSIGPFYDGGRVFVSDSILNDDGSNDMDRASSTTSLVCLHENNIKISNWTSGEFVMKVMEDDLYNDAQEEGMRDVDAREKVTCFVVHPSKSEVMVGNNLGLLKYYVILSAQYLEEHKRSKSSKITQASSTLLPESMDGSTGKGFTLIRTIKAHNMPVLCADIDATGTLVATGSTDMSVKVWDVRKGHCTHVFKGHSSALYRLYFSPSLPPPPPPTTTTSTDITLVSTSQDSTVKVWSLNDSKCVSTYDNHLSTATAIAWCPDEGRLMVSASRDKVMNFYIQSNDGNRANEMIHTEPVMDELECCVFMDRENAQRILHGDTSDNTSNKKSKSKDGSDSDGNHVLLTAGALGIVYFYEISFSMASTSSNKDTKKGKKGSKKIALEYSFGCQPLFKLIASGPLVMYEIAIAYSDSIAQGTSDVKSSKSNNKGKDKGKEGKKDGKDSGSSNSDRLPLSSHWSLSNSPTAYSTSTSTSNDNSDYNSEQILMSISQLIVNGDANELIVVTSDQTIASYLLSTDDSNVTTLTLSRQLVGNNDDILEITTLPFPHNSNGYIGTTSASANTSGGSGTDGSVSVYNNTTDSTPSEHALAAQSSVFSKVTEAAARYERKRMQQLQNIHSAFFNAIATNSPHLRVMDGRGGCQLLYGHTDVVLSLQGTPDGRYLLSSSKDSTVRLWDLFPTSHGTSTSPCPPVCIAIGRGHTEGVGGICISQKESNYTFPAHSSSKSTGSKTSNGGSSNKAAMLSFSVGADKILKRWNMSKAVGSGSNGNGSGGGGSMDYSRLTYSYGGSDDTGTTIDTTTATTTGATKSKGDRGNARTTLSTLQVNDPRVVSSTHSVRAHDKDINCVQLSPDDTLVATGSQDKTIKLWKSHDLTPVATLKGHKRGIWKIAFSPVDKCLASSSADRTIKIWSLTDHIVLRSLEGSAASVLTVYYINNGLQLLSGSADGLVRLWKCSNGECLTAMDEHTEKVWCISAPSEQVLRRVNGNRATGTTTATSTGKGSRSNDDGGSDNDGDGDENDDQEREEAMAVEDSEEIDTLSMSLSSTHIEPFFFTGSSDSTIKLWFDQTDEMESQRLIELEEKLLTEQSLDNDIRNKRYSKALKLALNLGHGSRTRTILQAILDDEMSNENVIFSTFEDMNEDVQAVGTGTVMSQFGDVKGLPNGNGNGNGNTSKDGNAVVRDGNSKHRVHSKAYNAAQAQSMLSPSNTWSMLLASPPLTEVPLDTSIEGNKVYCMTPEIHSQRLDEYISGMDAGHLNKVATFLLDWNTNAKYALLSQCILYSMIRVLGIDAMRSIPGVKENAKALIAYTDRHYERVKSLHKNTFALEYMINTMSLSLLGNVDILEGSAGDDGDAGGKEYSESGSNNGYGNSGGKNESSTASLAAALPLMVAGISSHDPRNQLSSINPLSGTTTSNNKKRKKEDTKSDSKSKVTAIDAAMFLQGDKFSHGTSLSTRVALQVQEAQDAKFHGTRVGTKKSKKAKNDLVVFYSSDDDSDGGDNAGGDDDDDDDGDDDDGYFEKERGETIAERRASYDTHSDSDDSTVSSASKGTNKGKSASKAGKGGKGGKGSSSSGDGDIFDEINREATEEAASLKANRGKRGTPSPAKKPSSASKGGTGGKKKGETGEKGDGMDVEGEGEKESAKKKKKEKKEKVGKRRKK